MRSRSLEKDLRMEFRDKECFEDCLLLCVEDDNSRLRVLFEFLLFFCYKVYLDRLFLISGIF